MAFLPLYSVAIPSDAPSAADSIAPSFQTPRSGCSSCAAPETHSPDTPTAEPEPSELVEVEFKGRRRLLCSNPARLPLRLRELVLVTSPHGIDAGHVSALGATAQRKQALYYNGAQPQERILRRATPQDQQQSAAQPPRRTRTPPAGSPACQELPQPCLHEAHRC